MFPRITVIMSKSWFNQDCGLMLSLGYASRSTNTTTQGHEGNLPVEEGSTA